MPSAVRFENVVKVYPGWSHRYRSLRAELGRQLGRPRHGRGKVALDDVSFDVPAGSSLGLVGPNGAGKTTALKLIARISYPTYGRLQVRGRVGALIAVGSGIHPELTGRENVWLYGRILGMTKPEIRARFDEIVDFAELASVLDDPVKTYSTGMQLRLGFSISSHVDPDVFVVDEALAVGDLSFQTKCIERMMSLVREGRTLIFVSHNLSMVEAVCPRTMLFLDGRVAKDGPTPDVIAHYITIATESRPILDASGVRVGTSCFGLEGDERYQFRASEGAEVRLTIDAPAPIPAPPLRLGISARGGFPVIEFVATPPTGDHKPSTRWEYRCRIDALPLRPRLYRVSYRLDGSPTWRDGAVIQVTEPGASHASSIESSMTAPVRVDASWEIDAARN